MIRVEITRSGDEITGYRMTGHAHGVHGQDVVCAAASTLAFSTCNTLTDVCHLSSHIDYRFSDGFFELILRTGELDERESHDAQIVLRGFEINIKDIEEQSPKEVHTTYKEVER